MVHPEIAKAAEDYGVDPEAYEHLFLAHFHLDDHDFPLVRMANALKALQIQANKAKPIQQ